MVIKVKVSFLGSFRRIFGRESIFIEMKESATTRNLIQKLSKCLPNEFKKDLIDSELEDPRPNALILVNEKEISASQGLETMVNNGDEIVLIPVSHGG